MSLDPFLGEIMYLATDIVPYGWLPCDGRALSPTLYSALHGLIGETYGTDDKGNFRLPDLRGRVPLACYPGGTNGPSLGTSAGIEQVQLAQGQIPAHTHALSVDATVSGSSNSATPTAGASLGQSGGYDSQTGNFAVNLYNSTLSSPSTVNQVMVQPVGSENAHENRQPFAVLNAYISMQGTYPPKPQD